MEESKKHSFLFFWLIVFLFSFWSKAYAQVNIERMRKNDLEEGFYGNSSIKFGFLSGNSSARNFTGEFRVDYIKDIYHVFLISNGKRGEGNNKLFQNKAFMHLRGKRSINETYAVEVFAQEEFNDFILLEERNLLGSGIRFTPFSPKEKDTDAFLHIGMGVMWENEYYEDDLEKTHLLRSSNYLSTKCKIKEWLIFSATSYYQVDTSQLSDFRILFNGNLGFNITDELLFTLTLNYRYDNEPVQNVKNFDLGITNGITYLF